MSGFVADEFERLKSALGDRYTIEGELGCGGMAVVHLARDHKLGRPVALKVLRPELAASIGAERFVREIEITARLTHPNILTIHDCGDADGILFYTMPFVEGESLRDRLNREKQLPIDEAIRMTREVADALTHAHELGIVHRDIKPENIMLVAGHAVVSDFGIARAVLVAGTATITDTGLAVGTPAYMSPEQATGATNVDARTDVYSLGCSLYEMLTGQPPFTGPNARAVVARHLTDPVPSISTVRPSVPQYVLNAITKALAKLPADRFHSARAFAEALAEEAHESAADSASIAVLPFANLSPDTEDEYFADGLTDELIAALSAIRSLRVISRTSSRLFKGERQSIPSIARQLGVRHVVEGTVRRAGNSVRITAQLIDGTTDTHVWSDRYSGTLDNIFDLQESLSQRIVEALEVTLAPEEVRSADARPALQAYDAYLRGRFYLEQVTADGRKRATEYFHQAIALDPTYARAFAALAAVYLQEAMLSGIPDHELAPRAQAAVDRALELDPTMGSAQTICGWLKLAHGWDWSGAEAAMRQAIESEPDDTTTLFGYAYLLIALGRLEESMAVSRRLLDLDPLSPMINSHHALEYYYARQYDRAIEQANRTVEMDPMYVSARGVQGAVYVQMGRHDDAVRAYADVMTLTGTPPHVIEQFRNRYRTEGVTGFWRWRAETRPAKDKAVAHAALGEIDEAFAWLARSADESPLGMMHLNVDPAFDPLRPDPRFEAMLERMNFPRPARAVGR